MTAGRLLAAGAICAVLILHCGIMVEIATQSRPVIWPLHNDSIHRLGPGADFYAVYHAAVNRGRGVSPYDNAPDGVTPYFYGFRYLPIVADAARLLTLAPPRAARIAWLVGLEALLALMVLLLWRSIRRPRLRWFAGCALLLSSPFFLEQYMGQFTFAALSLFALGLLVGRLTPAYAASVLLKVFPLAAAPALLRVRRHRRSLAIAALLAAGVSIPYFLLSPGDWQAFYALNARSEAGMHSGNYGLVYLVYLLAGDLGLQPLLTGWSGVTLIIRLLALGGTAWLVLASRNRCVVTGAVAMLLAHFVSYPHVWEHHASGILLLAALLLTTGLAEKRGLPVIIGSIVLLALPTPFLFFDLIRDPRVWDPAVDWPRYASYLVLLPKVIATAALYITCVAALWRAGRYGTKETLGLVISGATPRSS